MTYIYYISYFVKIMNEKNSFGLDICFGEKNNPFELFKEWFDEEKKTELNDPNAVALGTSDDRGYTSVRMVLLKDFNETGFVFYTNFSSAKGLAIKKNPNISMCFHWKSLLRQIRIEGAAEQVSDTEADEYYSSRKYESRIGAWASNQSSEISNRKELTDSIRNFKSKYPEQNNVPRPKHWSGWRLKPRSVEFWLDGEFRIHERLKYIKEKNDWKKILLSP